ncbi:MAG: hypothetical protein ACFFD4_26825 [Candidatus Odinarchaeota archaeon]
MENIWIPRLDCARIFSIILAWDQKGEFQGKSLYFFQGEVKLVKIDFFLRYPEKTKQLLKIRYDQLKLEGKNDVNTLNFEIPMEKWLRGPWDRNYYDSFAYARSLDFLIINAAGSKAWEFYLTQKGEKFTNDLIETDATVKAYFKRAKFLKLLFGSFSGREMELFIKDNETAIKDAELRSII